jgi:uncharacterized protein YndB with AHSA1/START domain
MSERTDVSTETVSKEVVITRIVDAPRDLVFKAWTEAEHLARWWGPDGFTNPVCESDPRPGGVLRIVMRGPDGTEYPQAGVFREVVAPERLVFEEIPEDADGRPLLRAATSVTFADREGRTEIRLHARAVALVPEAAPMLGGMQAGWNQSLQRLEDVLSGAVDRQIVLMRLLEAPRDLVFRAWTEREHVERWWGPTGFTTTIDEMDVRVGGTWRFVMHGPDGVDFPNTIVYEEIVPPERLVFTHGGSDDPPFRVTVTFEEFLGNTALTMRSVFVSAEERDRVVVEYNAIEGGNQTLDRLAEHVQGMG